MSNAYIHREVETNVTTRHSGVATTDSRIDIIVGDFTELQGKILVYPVALRSGGKGAQAYLTH